MPREAFHGIEFIRLVRVSLCGSGFGVAHPGPENISPLLDLDNASERNGGQHLINVQLNTKSMLTTEKNYETDNRTGVNHEGPRANTPVRRLTATSIIGDTVENAQGEDLGTIDNLMINLFTGQIEYAVIEFGGVLGIGDKLFAVPFSELKVNEDKEIFVLNRDAEYLKNSPGFNKDHWPATNDHDAYLENVSEYYQVSTPGFEI